MTVQIGHSTGQYTHARARAALPSAVRSTWLTPARRRGRGAFAWDRNQVSGLGWTERDVLTGREYESTTVQMFAMKLYDLRLVGHDLTRPENGVWSGSVAAVLEEAFKRWYDQKARPMPYEKPQPRDDNQGVASFVLIEKNLMEALNHDRVEYVRAQSAAEQAESERRHAEMEAEQAARNAQIARQTRNLRIGVAAGAAAVIGGIGYLIWRRSR